jgi:aminoglycoside phosphotransferase (APT) family kinase protein
MSGKAMIEDIEFEKQIDADLVRQMIHLQFPHWSDLKVSSVAHSGWDNRSFRLGQNMLVRLPSAARYVAQVEKEQRWLPYLAPKLPFKIPKPVAKGEPCSGYPWPWSVYEWIEGEVAAKAVIEDQCEFASALAEFLIALQKVDAHDAPAPGHHNFYRGGDLNVYDKETRAAIQVLNGRIKSDVALDIWNEALSSHWQRSPVWVHGDVSDGNLLVKNGQLEAVIDFGSTAVGDPACDLYPAWTFFNADARRTFRAALELESTTWKRGRGWALWKGLITLANQLCTSDSEIWANKVIDNVIADTQN